MSTPDRKTDLFVLKREAGGEPFRAEVDGITLVIPHIKTADQFELAALFAQDDQSDLEFITSLLALVMGEDIGTLRGLRLSRPELLSLYEAYNAHCGADSGESAASSD